MKSKRIAWIVALAAVLFVAAAIIGFKIVSSKNESQRRFMEKADLLKEQIMNDETVQALGNSPAGVAGYGVYFSICDGTSRAKVYGDTGKTLSSAWVAAEKSAMKALKEDSLNPLWVRADIVSNTWSTNNTMIENELYSTLTGFDFNGLALDDHFGTVLLEGELNGWGIYDYENDMLSISHLNECLESNGHAQISSLPESMTGFECWGWICDEDNTVYPLFRNGPDNTRRQVAFLDGDYARNIIERASLFLMNQVMEDGRFVYGILPQFDAEVDHYNILRHSGTIWSLLCRYRMFPEDALQEIIERTIEYMISQVKYDENGAAFLYEADDTEFKLGGNGIAVVALTEYMDVFQDERYRDVSVALGKGIVSMQDPKDGSYWHVLFSDFTKKEQFRTVYYDGECTFALLRLYELTREKEWLDAACLAIEHFIAEDYTQYRDHWVAYSLNEATKFVERQDFYDFALANAVNNYGRIEGQARTYPTNLELLIASFESWQRMVDRGFDTGDFDVQKLLDVISARANRQLSGFFYPEIAMYMANPQRIAGSFMMRNDDFRVRIDDVQHNIGGYYLYWKNYDAMVAAGLNASVTDSSERID